ncbi:unknown protein [Seminavis robusta]|uniref:Uncharacterized protein n=1 Tax=Seminavis robusta TaxID=568900 RepID=A0A9N8HS95_9STRA|nr:unknown protein [Seminavis robusta]|eukprot:Sro1144_g246130.1 n/a (442) ;mRNA; r:28890-30215
MSEPERDPTVATNEMDNLDESDNVAPAEGGVEEVAEQTDPIVADATQVVAEDETSLTEQEEGAALQQGEEEQASTVVEQEDEEQEATVAEQEEESINKAEEEEQVVPVVAQEEEAETPVTEEIEEQAADVMHQEEQPIVLAELERGTTVVTDEMDSLDELDDVAPAEWEVEQVAEQTDPIVADATQDTVEEENLVQDEGPLLNANGVEETRDGVVEDVQVEREAENIAKETQDHTSVLEPPPQDDASAAVQMEEAGQADEIVDAEGMHESLEVVEAEVLAKEFSPGLQNETPSFTPRISFIAAAAATGVKKPVAFDDAVAKHLSALAGSADMMMQDQLLNDVANPNDINNSGAMEQHVIHDESLKDDNTLLNDIDTPPPETIIDNGDDDGIAGSAFSIPPRAILQDVKEIMKKSPTEPSLLILDSSDDDEERRKKTRSKQP